MKKPLFLSTLILFALGSVVWLYLRAAEYDIVSQNSYGSIVRTDNVPLGYALRSRSDFKSALAKYNIPESSFDRVQGPVNFEKEFVFIVENGTLFRIFPGNSGFDVAAVSPSTNLSLSVVKGPRYRPIKTVARVTTGK